MTNGVEKRVVSLEHESSAVRRQLAEMANVQLTISEAISAFSNSQETISKSLEKLNETVERFRVFETRTETERKAEREHRDRLDTRVDRFQKEINDLRRDQDDALDKVYASLRKVESKLNDKITDIDKRFSVKAGVDSVNQNTTQKTLDLRGERLWKVLFWLLCAFGTFFWFK